MLIDVRRQQREELLAQRVKDAGWDGRHERSTAHGALAPSRAWPSCLPSTLNHAERRSSAYWRGLLITDVYSRRILGWRVSTAKTTPLVTSALEQALFTRRRGNAAFTATGLIHHSDAGSQYTSVAFTEALTEAGIAGSIGSVGDALDNALMESTIGLYKTELIDRQRSWTGRNEVERETAAWVHWFNTERLHSAIGYRPPVEFENNYRDTTATPVLEVA